jgi:hypothetical protein
MICLCMQRSRPPRTLPLAGALPLYSAICTITFPESAASARTLPLAGAAPPALAQFIASAGPPNVVQETMCDHALHTMAAEIRRKLGAASERPFLPQILPYCAAYFLQAASIQAMFAAQLRQVLSSREFVDSVRARIPC